MGGPLLREGCMGSLGFLIRLPYNAWNEYEIHYTPLTETRAPTTESSVGVTSEVPGFDRTMMECAVKNHSDEGALNNCGPLATVALPRQ
ncbi:hypothetical protein M8818_005652 [Zalaria obscura]|uniref:Uncharacterized protein n=1 Tax=Zalaria obscura TaxID=2024903 RepID=A0ACC3S9J9_9PEZI